MRDFQGDFYGAALKYEVIEAPMCGLCRGTDAWHALAPGTALRAEKIVSQYAHVLEARLRTGIIFSQRSDIYRPRTDGNREANNGTIGDRNIWTKQLGGKKMPPIVKALLPVVVVVVLIVIAFNVHTLLGIGLIVAIIGWGVYANRAIIHATRGNMAYSRGDEDAALAYMEKAYRTKRAMPQHLSGYAFLLNRKGKPEEAERILKEVLSKQLPDPVRIQVSVNLATAYYLQGKKEEACELLEQFYPEFKNTQLYGTLGYYKLLRGDNLEDVLNFNLEAYEYNSDDLTILDNLAQNYYFLGRLEEARDMYEKVMSKQPKSADPYYFYALTLQKLGREEEAREQIEKALHRDLALVSPLPKAEIRELAKQLGASPDDEVESE